jgi:hypothetical protein
MLNQDNVAEFIDQNELLPFDKYPSVQKYANHLRVVLLRKYGGVWADASVYCHQPLDDWIYDLAPNGVFLFSNPAPSRPIANWFMASLNPRLSGYVFDRFENDYLQYFRDNAFLSGRTANWLTRHLDEMLILSGLVFPSKSRIWRFWGSWFARRFLRLTPYFYFHYLWARLLESDKEFLQLLQGMKVEKAGPCFSLRGRLHPTNPQPLPANFDISQIRVSKLNHRALADKDIESWRPLLENPMLEDL